MSVPTFNPTEAHHVFLTIINDTEMWEHIHGIRTFDNFTSPLAIHEYMEYADPEFIIDEMFSSALALQHCLRHPANKVMAKELKNPSTITYINEALIQARRVIDRVEKFCKK